MAISAHPGKSSDSSFDGETPNIIQTGYYCRYMSVHWKPCLGFYTANTLDSDLSTSPKCHVADACLRFDGTCRTRYSHTTAGTTSGVALTPKPNPNRDVHPSSLYIDSSRTHVKSRAKSPTSALCDCPDHDSPLTQDEAPHDPPNARPFNPHPLPHPHPSRTKLSPSRPRFPQTLCGHHHLESSHHCRPLEPNLDLHRPRRRQRHGRLFHLLQHRSLVRLGRRSKTAVVMASHGAEPDALDAEHDWSEEGRREYGL